MSKKAGLICSLIGIGLFFVSFLMAEKYHTSLDLLSNIYRMEIVLKEGYFQEAKKVWELGMWKTVEPAYYEGRIAIPLKYALSFSTVLVLVGLGGVLLGKETGRKEGIENEKA